MGVLFLSSFFNLSLEFVVFNVTDEPYKYELEEAEYERIYNHRVEKGLPTDPKMSVEEIEYKYGFAGLLNLNRTGYILNVIVSFLMYLPALFFNHIRKDIDEPVLSF